MTRVAAAILLFLLLFPFNALAKDGGAEEEFQGYVKVVKQRSDYTVNADGTSVLLGEAIEEVLTEEGIEAVNHRTLSYSETMETLEILEAYTLKKNGTRIDVPKENIQERTAYASGGPMYSDIKAKVVIFPSVEVGDRTALSFKLTDKVALFPGHFTMSRVFSKGIIYDDAAISVSVPEKTLKLNVFAFGVEGGEAKKKDGRLRWEWKFKNAKIEKDEPGSVSAMDYEPRIFVSSFKDYQALGAAYEARAAEKSRVTDDIKKRADEITKGISGQREQAEALYNWVAKNVTYVGNAFGVGSVVPHDIDMILANQLGDCKDHTVLLKAFLAAKGIESEFVLVDASDSYRLPEVPVVGAFNHVINYLPSLDMYLDPTARFVSFGVIPPGSADKEALHTSNGVKLRRVPPLDYRKNTASSKSFLRIKKDGSAEGERIVGSEGVFSILLRGTMAYVKPNKEEDMIRRSLSAYGYNGSGTLKKDDPWEPAKEYNYSVKYKLENFIDVPGQGVVKLLPVFSGVSVAMAVANTDLPERKIDYGCMGGIVSEEYSIDIPENVTILSMPKDVHLAAGDCKYDAVYKQKDKNITVSRRFESSEKGNRCTPEDYKHLRAISLDVKRDLRAQILYEAN